MFKAITVCFKALFPIELRSSASSFVAKSLRLPEQASNISKLDAAAASARSSIVLKEIRDTANAKREDEAKRQASIINRAQGLFVALAMFGVVLTVGTGLFADTTQLQGWAQWIGLGIAVYVLLQMIMMVINILRAISGIEYPTTGSSDLTAWLHSANEVEFYRQQALLTLKHYRIASLNNTWRFRHLDNALTGLRNFVFALAIMIVLLFIAKIGNPYLAPPKQSKTPAFEQPCHQDWQMDAIERR